MTLLPPEFRGGEDPYGHRGWRERNGGRLLVALSVAGVIVLAATFVISSENSDSAPPAATTTTQPDALTSPSTTSTTVPPATTTSAPPVETTTTFNADITWCIGNFYKPSHKNEHDIVLGNARRTFIERYGFPPEDPDQFAYNVFVESCKQWYGFGGRISNS